MSEKYDFAKVAKLARELLLPTENVEIPLRAGATEDSLRVVARLALRLDPTRENYFEIFSTLAQAHTQLKLEEEELTELVDTAETHIQADPEGSIVHCLSQAMRVLATDGEGQ